MTAGASCVAKKEMRVFSMEEVRTHDSADDCWIVVDRKVYDVTNFAESHPGGSGVVRAMAGMDATQQFHVMHGTGRSIKKAQLMMRKYCIGEIADSPYMGLFYSVRGKDSTAPATKPAAEPLLESKTISLRHFRTIDGEMPVKSIPIPIPLSKWENSDNIASDTTSPSSSSSRTFDREKINNNSAFHSFERVEHSNNSSDDENVAHDDVEVRIDERHDVQAGDIAFSKLREEITSDADLWRAKWSDTAIHMARAVPFLCLTLAILFHFPSTDELSVVNWLAVAVAGWALGMFWHQSAFVAHDACHRGTPEDHGNWHWFGTIYGSFIFGISTSMWADEHYQHHVATRKPQGDPQFQYYPICLLSLKELDENHPPDFIAKIFFRIQHIIFLPIAVIIGRVNFHLISLTYAVRSFAQFYILPRKFGGKPRPALFRPECDLVGMAFYALYNYALLAQVPNVWAKALFFVASNWTCGLLHLQLLVSHIGVECFTHEEQMQQSWFSHQVLTSRNVTTSWWNAWYWGGLEYQIEHHLFPRLPRSSLAKIAPRVRKLCEEQ